jgi:uncharacterized protein YbjQ (UPF0145 family)
MPWSVAITIVAAVWANNAEAQITAGSIKFTTTEELHGCTVTKYLGIVTSALRLGGDRAESQKDFPAAYSAVLANLGEQGAVLGGNWVLKVEFTVIYGYDRDGRATGHFPQRLAATGTAVQAICPR